MDAAVIAAVIGVVGTVGGSTISAIAGARQGRKAARSDAESLSQQTAKSFQAQLVERFGFKAEKIASHMTVLDVAGNASVSRRWRGIKVQEGHSVSHVSGEFWVTTPGGTISKLPELTGVDGYRKEVSFVPVSRSDNRCRYRVEIAGSLLPSDPPLDFDLEVQYEHCVLMSRKAVDEAYVNEAFKRDYVAFDVEVPIDSLELKIEFPPGTDVTTYPSVFYGWSEHPHSQELARSKSGFEPLPSGGRFVVREPLVGFRYLIYWTFPLTPKGVALA